MNRSILIVTPFFAPQSHAAVFRAYKLAKYLPQYGWKPYIVTTDTNYLYNEDPGLLEALPPEVEIHRARYIEPTLRGLRMALGGKDRTFKALKERGELPAQGLQPGETAPSWKSDFLARLYRYLLDAWVRVPDAYWTWEKPAFERASRLAKQHNIPLVFTSADPFTSHQIGYKLQQDGLRWVADFRDPATHSYWIHSQIGRVFLQQRSLEQLAVQNADAVVVQAQSVAVILAEMFGLPNNHPIHFIPTGLDEELLGHKSAIQTPTVPYFVFVGEYLPGYGDQFFRIFTEAIKNPDIAKTGIQCLFIGRTDVNAPLLNPMIAKYKLEQHIQLIDHLPQQDLYAYLKNAQAALLIPGKLGAWWRLFAKLVDYLALRIPTIAIVPEPGEARLHLQKSGLGIFLDGDEKEKVRRLTEYILGKAPNPQIDATYCDQFLASAQVQAFTKLFEDVLG